MILHAGFLALRVGRAWCGALIGGSSGSGKSDLMLRAMDSGLRLVADDRTLAWTSQGRLYGRAPEALDGLIELRGLGVLLQPRLWLAPVVLMVRCEPQEMELERFPEGATETIADVELPLLRVHAFEASAPAKLGRALWRLGQGRSEA